MAWTKEYLDVVLVPSGLLIMSTYHVFLLYRCFKFPETTVIGYENHFRKACVERMLQVEAKDRGLSLATINSTISAATFLATTSLALSSLIGTWFADSSQNLFRNSLVYGSTSASTISVKYISLLVCFLAAFGSFLQCVGNFVHASFLISMPNADIPVSYVQKAVIRGSACWSVGLRAIYYATTLLLWIFGPIMFVASVIMVLALHMLDTNVTSLHKFEPANSGKMFTKINEELTAVLVELLSSKTDQIQTEANFHRCTANQVD